MKPIADTEGVEKIIAEVEHLPEIDRLSFLSEYFYDLPVEMPSDPFSSEYLAAVKELWEKLTGHTDYDPAKDEIAPDLRQDLKDMTPGPYGRGDSAWLGESWLAWGFILQQLKLPAGKKVIEFGPGWGAVSLALARNGCDVTVVDIEPAYLESIEHQARQVGVQIRTHQGTFGEVPAGSGRFDAVIFLEAFHHCLDHNRLLDRLHEITTADAVICLGDEPVFGPTDMWAPAVPFPWGPRLDLVSIRAGRLNGWLELGFQEDYLVEAMLRSGWLADRRICPLTRRGTCYLGREFSRKLPLNSTLLPAVHERTWHPPEALGRWSRGQSSLPIPTNHELRMATVEVVSYRASPMWVRVSSGKEVTAATLQPGEVEHLTVPLGPLSTSIEISSETFVPNEEIFNGDTRSIGVFVHAVEFA